MLAPVKNIAGEQVGEVELNEHVFAAPVSRSLMHQALIRQLSNARFGTHKTKTRGEVRGGGHKPFRQKGTGRARQGTIRAPQWVGGGTVFGPTPRKYIKQMPRKMRQAALRSALSVKVEADQLVILDNLSMIEPKTKSMLAILNALNLNDNTVLLVLPEKDTAVERSANNLPNVKTLISGYLNIRDLLGYDVVVMSQAAVAQVDTWLG